MKRITECKPLFTEQWHLVSDYTPDTLEEVLFCTKEGRLHLGLYNEDTCEFSQFDGSLVPIEEVSQWRYLPVREVFGCPTDGDTVVVSILGADRLALGMYTDRFDNAHGDRVKAVIIDPFYDTQSMLPTDGDMAIAWEGVQFWFKVPVIEKLREPEVEVGRKDGHCEGKDCKDETKSAVVVEIAPQAVPCECAPTEKAETPIADAVPSAENASEDLTDAMVDLTDNVVDSSVEAEPQKPIEEAPMAKSQIASAKKQDAEYPPVQEEKEKMGESLRFRDLVKFTEDYGWEIKDGCEWDAFDDILEDLGAQDFLTSLLKALDGEIVGEFIHELYTTYEAFDEEYLRNALEDADLKDIDDFKFFNKSKAIDFIIYLAMNTESYETLCEDICRYIGLWRMNDILAFICRNHDIRGSWLEGEDEEEDFED